MYFYALDGLPVLLAVAPYAVFWPPCYLSDVEGWADGQLDNDVEMEMEAGAEEAEAERAMAGKTPALQGGRPGAI